MNIYWLYLLGLLYLVAVYIILFADHPRMVPVWQMFGGGDAKNADADVEVNDAQLKTRAASKPIMRVIAAVAKEGRNWFDHDVYPVPRAQLSEFIAVSSWKDRLNISGRKVDILLVSAEGTPLLAMQLQKGPAPGDEDYATHWIMVNAGLPVAYLGADPSTENLGLMVSAMRRTQRFTHEAPKEGQLTCH
jgi:hypothetical protein